MMLGLFYFLKKGVGGGHVGCQNVEKCCKMLWIRIDLCKVKRGSWSRSLAGPWLAKHYLPYKICIFFVFNFFTLLIHRQFVFSSTNSSSRPEVHFDVVVSFWLLYDWSQKTKTKSQKWKEKVDLMRHLKSIAVGLWAQGWPLLAEI